MKTYRVGLLVDGYEQPGWMHEMAEWLIHSAAIGHEGAVRPAVALRSPAAAGQAAPDAGQLPRHAAEHAGRRAGLAADAAGTG
ncbi:hypothetical protein G6F61_014812 [Rhizopus arrhizus]|nr:hypothetical protein G6F61_014812 [Rhizopus arrhizus]